MCTFSSQYLWHLEKSSISWGPATNHCWLQLKICCLCVRIVRRVFLRTVSEYDPSAPFFHPMIWITLVYRHTLSLQLKTRFKWQPTSVFWCGSFHTWPTSTLSPQTSFSTGSEDGSLVCLHYVAVCLLWFLLCISLAIPVGLEIVLYFSCTISAGLDSKCFEFPCLCCYTEWYGTAVEVNFV